MAVRSENCVAQIDSGKEVYGGNLIEMVLVLHYSDNEVVTLLQTVTAWHRFFSTSW